jgi:probable HAF family extracellular repeat protein
MQRLACVLLFASLGGCADQERHATPTDVERASFMLEPVYELEIVESTLGGSLGVGAGINNAGTVAGYATLADNTRHAAVWRNGVIEDLGTLGGPSSAVLWPGINNTGMVVGVSFTDTADPHDADWSCEAFLGASDRTCRGFYWEGNGMQPLQTLGGHNGFATAVNNAGQIVGWAETSVADESCKLPQVLTFHAVLWEPKAGGMQALPPLSGDAASAATGINNRGQVVGISGSCYVAVGDSSARAAVLWENGVPRELPNLGGTRWHTPMDINEAGHVVGFGSIGDDDAGNARLRAFLWTGGSTVSQIGPLKNDDTLAQAYGINTRGQAVGRSCGAGGCRAFLYDKGGIHDLNNLMATNGAVLELARHINDAGVITGNLVHEGRVKMFIATPRGYRRTKT